MGSERWIKDGIEYVVPLVDRGPLSDAERAKIEALTEELMPLDHPAPERQDTLPVTSLEEYRNRTDPN